MKNNEYRFILFGSILIALGVVITVLSDSENAIGIVVLAIGGLFFILGMAGLKKGL
jgi:hypothetical protein